MRMTALLALPLALCSCASADVRSWGTMREALRDGRTEARVDAARVVTANTVGVGAAADLQGEITILDGEVLRTVVLLGEARSTATDSVPATLLAVADVSAWREVTIPHDLGADALEAFVQEAAERAGIDTSEPFPFVVRGPLRDLRLHVINGQCPVRARLIGEELVKPPFEREVENATGTLVGIFAADSAGVLTHHTTSMHVHVVLDGIDGRWTGHVEKVGVGEGAVLRLPE